MMGERKPALRFKGFEGEWNTCRLGDIALFNPKADIPEQFEYVDLESVVGNEMVSHRTETRNAAPSRAQRLAKKGDIFYQTVRPYQKNNCLFEKSDGVYVFSTGYAQMRPNTDSYFLLSLVQNNLFLKSVLNQCTGTSYPAISSTNLDDIEVSLSTYEENRKIGVFFKHLDVLITQQQRKYDSLLNVKKSLLEKMFPKDGADVPEIRFKGFEGKWRQRQFGDIVDSYQDPVPTPHNGYTRLGIRSHAKGTFHSYVEKGRELETAQMHRVAAGNFIVNITFGWEHAVAITEGSDAGKLVSHRFPQFRFHDGLNPEFFKYVIIDEKFRHHLWLASPGGAGRNRVLKINEMLEYKMAFPSEDEQEKIAIYFKHLDTLITQHHQKLDHLNHIKSALLEKMFVSEAA